MDVSGWMRRTWTHDDEASSPMMHLHYFQHVPFENPGHILDWAGKRGCRVSSTKFHEDPAPPDPSVYDFLVVMGGPMGIEEEERFPWLRLEKEHLRMAVRQEKRILGVCLGAQLLACVLGAAVLRNRHREIGWFAVEKIADFDHDAKHPLPMTLDAFHWHGDTFQIPKGAQHLFRSEACPNQAFLYRDRVLGLQFHLEVTPDGAERLIRHCGDELRDGGVYVQDAGDMLAVGSERFQAAHRHMDALLDYLAPPAGRLEA